MNRHPQLLRLPPATRPADLNPTERPDVAFASLDLFTRLRDGLRAAAAKKRAGGWDEPGLFFFDRKVQAEWERVKPRRRKDDVTLLLEEMIEDAVVVLSADRDARHMARTVPGLREAVETYFEVSKSAYELAALLAVADDEVVRVIAPHLGVGFRVFMRGIADLRQFYVLLTNAVVGDPARGLLPGGRPAASILSAYSDDRPAAAEIYSPRFQMFRVGALQPDGTLPTGFSASDRWLWGQESLLDVEAIAGERTILLGPPTYQATWEAARKLPQVGCELRVLEVLSQAQVADWIAARTGHRPTWEGMPRERKAA